jgi:hypothetical protein
MSPQDDINVVQSERFELIDRNGRVRAVLGVGEAGP